MRSTFWMYEPSGFPGLSPSFWNWDVRYATAFSSPGVPGARPSIESAARSLMCWRSDAVSIACAAVVTAADVAVVSVKAVVCDDDFEESEDATDLFSTVQPRATSAVSRVLVRQMEFTELRVEGCGTEFGVSRSTQ